MSEPGIAEPKGLWWKIVAAVVAFVALLIGLSAIGDDDSEDRRPTGSEQDYIDDDVFEEADEYTPSPRQSRDSAMVYPTPRSPSPSSPPPPAVVYEVTGSGTAMITYTTDSSGSMAQESDAELPWRVELPQQTGAYPFYSVSAQDNGDGGAITCRIFLHGRLVTEVTSSGEYAIASCVQ